MNCRCFHLNSVKHINCNSHLKKKHNNNNPIEFTRITFAFVSVCVLSRVVIYFSWITWRNTLSPPPPRAHIWGSFSMWVFPLAFCCNIFSFCTFLGLMETADSCGVFATCSVSWSCSQTKRQMSTGYIWHIFGNMFNMLKYIWKRVFSALLAARNHQQPQSRLNSVCEHCYLHSELHPDPDPYTHPPSHPSPPSTYTFLHI